MTESVERFAMYSSKRRAVVFLSMLSTIGWVAGRHLGRIGNLSNKRVCMSELSIRLRRPGLEIRLEF